MTCLPDILGCACWHNPCINTRWSTQKGWTHGAARPKTGDAQGGLTRPFLLQGGRAFQKKTHFFVACRIMFYTFSRAR
jgi:hypothetical protein